MKSQDIKEEFIRLRAKGLSFDKISKEINTSKPILLKWNEELEKEIANRSYLEVEIMLEQYRLAKMQGGQAWNSSIWNCRIPRLTWAVKNFIYLL